MAESTSTPDQRPVKIYALHDCNGRIRYVGKTVYKLARRIMQHRNEANRGHHCKRCNWIRKELAANRIIGIELLELVTDGSWEQREQHWIATMRGRGYNLTNLTDGGEGLHGFTFSAEHRAKIGAKSRGRKKSAAELEKMSIAMRGRFGQRCSRRDG